MARKRKQESEEMAARRRWHEESMRQADAARLKREAEEITEENDLIRMCIEMDGEFEFYRWWDNDEKVPSYETRGGRIELLKKRLGVHEDSLADKKADVEKSGNSDSK